MRKFAVEIKSNLEQTITNIQAAKESLANGQYDAAAARAAESAFHAASVLLLNEEIETSKHEDVITRIHQDFVEKRRLTKEQGEKLNWLFQLGKAGNSDASTPLIPGEAEKAVQFAESFFEAAKVILDS
jgi:uncharacterized protein (UPF0332 family)